MSRLQLLFCTGIIAVCTACNSSKNTKQPSVTDYFQETSMSGNMLFEVAQDSEETVGDTIPTSFFFSQLETRMMNEIQYIDNSGELTVIGRSRFPLNENVEACLVDMRQGWYQHQSLFLFDKKTKAFTSRVTVAEFYGGDGGQILTGSCLTDFDDDGDADIVRREIEHWLDLTGEEPVDTLAHNASLLVWDGARFAENSGPDSAILINSCPIQSFW